jgi:aspartate carbamoyltransferase catalytic subunit
MLAMVPMSTNKALLDLYTIKEKMGRIDGLKVAIIGDISHSRVARSNIIDLQKWVQRLQYPGSNNDSS